MNLEQMRELCVGYDKEMAQEPEEVKRVVDWLVGLDTTVRNKVSFALALGGETSNIVRLSEMIEKVEVRGE
jgi:hypothetical protein